MYLNLNVSEKLTIAWDLPPRGCSVPRAMYHQHQNSYSGRELFISVKERSTTWVMKRNIHGFIRIKKIKNQDSLSAAHLYIQEAGSIMHLTKVATNVT